MEFPLTETLALEAERYDLRSACGDCFFYLADRGACLHGWPTDTQRVPIAELARGERGPPRSAPFCKEFELA